MSIMYTMKVRMTPVEHARMADTAHALGISQAELGRRAVALYSELLFGTSYADENFEIVIEGESNARCKKRNA